ncbi:MAG: response regulator [Candidatus Aureabacteria bacterium]|nr:response regulator [Candidatus Auribacterota bacterium]
MAKKILVVDDEPNIMDVATVRLKRLGYEIISAFDAEKALTFLQNVTPDLILLDLLLPQMQGDELCKKLKSDDKFKHIPIIIFTASAIRTSLPEKIKEMGADDCIMKPFDPEELLGKVTGKVNKFIR